MSPQAPYPLNQDSSLSNAGIQDLPSSQEALCGSLYKDNAAANSIEALSLLLTAPYTLYCGSSFDLASLLRVLPSKMSPSNGLDEEDRVSCLQILAATVLGFQTLLDYSGAIIETSCSKIVQERQYVSTEEDLCKPELILIRALALCCSKHPGEDLVCHIPDF